MTVAAFIIAAAAILISAIQAKRTASRDWVSQLEVRVKLCEEDRTVQRQEITHLRAQNYDLMTRMLRLEQGET